MLLSRVLGGLGRFFIALGVLTLLFVAYQLWGTGILTAQAQGALEDDFEDILDEAALVESESVDTDQADVDTGDQDDEAAAEAAAEEARSEERRIRRLSRLLWQPDGEPVAKIFAPTIDLDWTVVAGVGTDELAKGPGHYTSTPMPGQPGNASIAGHRTTWGAPFNRIDELQPGDQITVQTAQGTFVYRVVPQEGGVGHFIVTPDRVDVLGQDFDVHTNRLTLTSCHPKFSSRQRIIVVAELVGEPADFIGPPGGLGPTESLASEDVAADTPAEPATDDGTSDDGASSDDEPVAAGGTGTDVGDPGDPAAAGDPDAATSTAPAEGSEALGAAAGDFGEGLEGDSTAIVPSILWGLAAGAIWFTAWYTARRWKAWPSYALGIAPFAVVLFTCFVYIDRAIPSY